MKKESLKKVLNVLIDMKASIHDTANTSVNERLDEAIALIQESIEGGNQDNDTQLAIVSVLSKVFDNLPSIIALLQLLSK